jgi:hypothetical protein
MDARLPLAGRGCTQARTMCAFPKGATGSWPMLRRGLPCRATGTSSTCSLFSSSTFGEHLAGTSVVGVGERLSGRGDALRWRARRAVGRDDGVQADQLQARRIVREAAVDRARLQRHPCRGRSLSLGAHVGGPAGVGNASSQAGPSGCSRMRRSRSRYTSAVDPTARRIANVTSSSRRRCRTRSSGSSLPRRRVARQAWRRRPGSVVVRPRPCSSPSARVSKSPR